MIRTFTKSRFLEILQDHPVNIRRLEKPAPEFIAKCIICNPKTIQYIDPDWLTLPVLQSLIPKIIEAKYERFYLIASFSQEVRDSLPEPELRTLCQENANAVQNFPKAPYGLFLNHAKRSEHIDLKEIPSQHWTEDLICTIFTRHPHNNSLPKDCFTDSIVDKALEKNVECINHTPKKFLTNPRLTKVFTKKPDLELEVNEFECTSRKLQDCIDCWDQPLDDLATARGMNMGYIPNKFITKDMCKRAVLDSGLKYIPFQFQDEDVVAIHMCASNVAWMDQDPIPLKLLKPSFLLKLAKMDEESDRTTCFGVKSYSHLKEITPDQWLKVLKICPKAIQRISKEKQTPVIINTFLEKAPIEIIDKMHPFINLARITKNQVPFLVGSTIKLFQDIVTRKMAPKPRAQKHNEEELKVLKESPKVFSEDTVAVDLTDSDYLTLTKKYGQ